MAVRRPDLTAYVVSETGDSTRWREVGVAFWNRNGDTLTVLLDAIPLSGRLVLLERRKARTAGEPGAQR